MATRNDVTGDELKSRGNTQAFQDGYERIWGSKKKAVEPIKEKPINPHNTAVIGAFMTEGLFAAGYDACIGHWGKGCFEMIYEMTSYAAWLEQKVTEAIEVEGLEVCGVYDYEVSVPFGKWFGEQIIANPGYTPRPEACFTQLRQLHDKFFAQGNPCSA